MCVLTRIIRIRSNHSQLAFSLFTTGILNFGRFHLRMVDALNAEIALGTVTSVAEGVRWLGYTYLFVRMCKNPFHYGKGNFGN